MDNLYSDKHKCTESVYNDIIIREGTQYLHWSHTQTVMLRLNAKQSITQGTTNYVLLRRTKNSISQSLFDNHFFLNDKSITTQDGLDVLNYEHKHLSECSYP